ncbi:unnamed protein product [Jaminaea pallidilutea]
MPSAPSFSLPFEVKFGRFIRNRSTTITNGGGSSSSSAVIGRTAGTSNRFPSNGNSDGHGGARQSYAGSPGIDSHGKIRTRTIRFVQETIIDDGRLAPLSRPVTKLPGTSSSNNQVSPPPPYRKPVPCISIVAAPGDITEDMEVVTEPQASPAPFASDDTVAAMPSCVAQDVARWQQPSGCLSAGRLAAYQDAAALSSGQHQGQSPTCESTLESSGSHQQNEDAVAGDATDLPNGGSNIKDGAKAIGSGYALSRLSDGSAHSGVQPSMLTTDVGHNSKPMNLANDGNDTSSDLTSCHRSAVVRPLQTADTPKQVTSEFQDNRVIVGGSHYHRTTEPCVLKDSACNTAVNSHAAYPDIPNAVKGMPRPPPTPVPTDSDVSFARIKVWRDAVTTHSDRRESDFSPIVRAMPGAWVSPVASSVRPNPSPAKKTDTSTLCSEATSFGTSCRRRMTAKEAQALFARSTSNPHSKQHMRPWHEEKSLAATKAAVDESWLAVASSLASHEPESAGTAIIALRNEQVAGVRVRAEEQTHVQEICHENEHGVQRCTPPSQRSGIDQIMTGKLLNIIAQRVGLAGEALLALKMDLLQHGCDESDLLALRSHEVHHDDAERTAESESLEAT